MSSLRFVIRNGEKVLQYSRTEIVEDWKSDGGILLYKDVTEYKLTWHDVPLIDESTGVEIEEEEIE